MPPITTYCLYIIHFLFHQHRKPAQNMGASEDELDVDDSDLLHILEAALTRPPPSPHAHMQCGLGKRKKSLDRQGEAILVSDFGGGRQSPPPPLGLPYLIPGPAGAWQRGLAVGARVSEGKLSLSNSSFAPAQDSDFLEEPWLLVKSGLDREGGERITVSDVKSLGFRGRVPKLAAIIVALTPNDFGDAFVNLKDVSGNISGTIHRKVFEEPNYGKDVVCGAVIVLHNVATFRPTPSTQLLNITVHNVMKVIIKGDASGGNIAEVPGFDVKVSKVGALGKGKQLEALEDSSPASTCTLKGLAFKETASDEIHESGILLPSAISAGPNRLSAVEEPTNHSEEQESTDFKTEAVVKAAGWNLSSEDLEGFLDCTLDDLCC